MTETEWRREFAKLAARVEALENAAQHKTVQSAKVPKRLPFADDTPLAGIVKRDAQILLCSTIDAWRPLLKENCRAEDDLRMTRFDFVLSDFPYEKFFVDVAELIRQGGFRYSVNVVAWYFVLHSNLPISHYSLYTSLLNRSRQPLG